MRKMLMALCLMNFVGCVDPAIHHNNDGTVTATLDCNQKLVTATMAAVGLTYLTRPMHPDEVAETYSLHFQNQVYTLIESTCPGPVSTPPTGNCLAR